MVSRVLVLILLIIVIEFLVIAQVKVVILELIMPQEEANFNMVGNICK
jgi:hypothetical protein